MCAGQTQPLGEGTAYAHLEALSGNHLRSLVRDLECTGNALQILKEDFAAADSIGPKRVAEFLEEPDDEELAADVVGFVRSLISLVDDGGPREDEANTE